VDAAVTKSIAARAGGHVTYIGYKVPRDVFVDYKLIKGAPSRLNRSGVGDIVSAHVALWDWKLANERKAEPYDPEAVRATQAWLDRLDQVAESIDEVTAEGIRFIMEAFEDISVICRNFGSSRPQEASEHTFAYNAEFQTGKDFLHGELIALGSFVMASLQDNEPDWLLEIFQRTGLLWQPKDINLTRAEFEKTMTTLNWYQKNYGRRYSILDVKMIDGDFIDQMMEKLKFV
jgi:glycerol-1-phosphate dehydrogenase [NAD(P)+]